MFFFLNRSFFISMPHPRRFKVTKNFRERSEPYNLQRLCEATNYKDFRFNVNNGSSKTSCLTHFKRTLLNKIVCFQYSKQSLFKLIKSFKYQCPTLKFVGLSKAKSHLIKVSTDFAVVGVLNASYRCFGIHKSYRHAGCN